MVYEVSGDIIRDFIHEGNIIFQQINCCSCIANKNSFGGKLSRRLPYSNVYCDRRSDVYDNLARVEDRPTLGSLIIRSGKVTEPIVVNLCAQYRMGDPSKLYYLNGNKTDSIYLYTSKNLDSSKHRLQYFSTCLDNVLQYFKSNEFPLIKKLIFPGFIGCGLAQGNWSLYKDIIIKFSQKIETQYNVSVYIVYFNIGSSYNQ